MQDNKVKAGIVIKGKDLKEQILCKIISEDMNMHGFQYKVGMNEDVNPLSIEEKCDKGLHFCIIKDICDYLNYGTKLAIVNVPDDEDVYVDDGKFRTHRLIIDKIMPLEKVETWKFLYENGADITADYNYAVRWNARNGHLEIVKYLHENGVDITVWDNNAVRWAARKGHLEIVKYLHKNGADITALDNYALKWAKRNGHFDVVEYIHKNSTDISWIKKIVSCF